MKNLTILFILLSITVSGKVNAIENPIINHSFYNSSSNAYLLRKENSYYPINMIYGKGESIQSSLYLVDSIHNYEREGIKYTYNQDGRLSLEYKSKESGIYFRPYRRAIHIYENNYRRHTITYELQVYDDPWEIEKKTIKEYDDRGNHTLVRFELWNEGERTSIGDNIYTWDDNDNQLSFIFKALIDGEWEIITKSTSTYDENNNRLTVFSESYHDDEPPTLSGTRFTYDNFGKITKAFKGKLVDGELQVSSWESYFYSISLLDSIIVERQIDGEMFISRTYTYTYDDNGNKLSYLQKKTSSGILIDDYRETYTYDDNDSILTYLEETAVTGEFKNRHKESWAYNGDGYLVKWNSWDWNGTDWHVSSDDIWFSDVKSNDFHFYGYEVDISWFELSGIIGPKSPENSSIMISTSPDIEWNELENADSYQLQIAEDVDFNMIILDENGILEPSFPVTGLENYQVYYWRYRGEKVDSTFSWSETWSFRTIAQIPTEKAVMLQPANNAVNIPLNSNLNWNDTELADRYQVQISTDDQFLVSSLAIDDVVYNETEKSINALLSATEYFWRVAASNEAGSAPWSDIWNFTTEMESNVFESNDIFSTSVTPNPFDRSTLINFNIKRPGNVMLYIHDALGNRIEKYGMDTWKLEAIM